MSPMKWQGCAGKLTTLAALAALGLGVRVSQAAFVPPAEGPVPFRRDKLPVDVETMTALSRQVLSLTGAEMAEGPARLRALAQMTALALALDPANRQAREVLEELQGGGRPEDTGDRELDRAVSRAWQVHAWLQDPEAGADAQALAACLADVLSVADPKNPKAEDHRREGETGAWKSWVAPETAFQDKTTKPPVAPNDPGMENRDDSSPGENSKPQIATIAMPDVTATMPLWVVKGPPRNDEEDRGKRNGNGNDNNNEPSQEGRILEVLRIDLSATASDKGEGLMFGFDSRSAADATSAAASEVSAFMAKRHGSTGPVTAAVSWDKTRHFLPGWNGGALSGTSALMADAALSGKPPGAMALAVVGKGGKLELPPHFWDTLRAFAAQSSGGRLIVPTSAGEYLTGLLVLDQAAFFMNHEVLLAGTVEELCDIGSGAPKPEQADAFTKFQEIRKAGAGKPLGSFVAHPSTQTRLKELGTALPQHASARLLALQGSGNRPRFLQRNLLAREIREAMLPMGELEHVETDKLASSRLDEIHQMCRAKLDKIGTSGLVDIRDRDLHKAAVAAADSLRALARMMDKKDEDNPYTILSKQISLHKDALREYNATLGTLTEAAGDQEEFKLPKGPKQPRNN